MLCPRRPLPILSPLVAILLVLNRFICVDNQFYWTWWSLFNSCLNVKWAGIQMLFEYVAKLSLVFRPPTE